MEVDISNIMSKSSLDYSNHMLCPSTFGMSEAFKIEVGKKGVVVGHPVISYVPYIKSMVLLNSIFVQTIITLLLSDFTLICIYL